MRVYYYNYFSTVPIREYLFFFFINQIDVRITFQNRNYNVFSISLFSWLQNIVVYITDFELKNNLITIKYFFVIKKISLKLNNDIIELYKTLI